MATQKKQNDFDPNELIATSAAHEKTLGELHKTVVGMEKRVGTDAALASSFKSAFDNDRNMDKVLVDLISHLIQTDDGVKSAITKAVNKVDREWQASILKKLGFAFWTILVAVVSGAVVLLIN